MAAVGGLFSSVSGSAQVARSMYNDARRLTLATYNARHPDGDAASIADDKFVLAKTFLLLGLYGLCSGDKRSYELVEACYADLTGAVLEYADAVQDSTAADDRNVQLLDALFIFDCYRVIVMIRPPLMPWHTLESVAEGSAPASKLSRLLSCTENLFNPMKSIEQPVWDAAGLAVLASNAPHIWSAMYPRFNADLGDNVLVEAIDVGRPYFAEIACERWLSAHTAEEPINTSHMAVYHMMNILLHANMTLLQIFAHSPPDSPTRDPATSAWAREVLRWTQDRHHGVALWHAEQLIGTIETAVAHRVTDQHHNSSRTSRNQSTTDAQESPHVPYAVYFATLVQWCGGIMRKPPMTATELQAPIVRSQRILLLHKIHIAKLLAKALSNIN